MRPLQGTGEIGDSISLAVIGGGIVAEIGSVRKYDPVNPCDIAPGDPVMQAEALFPAFNMTQAIITDMPEAQLTMTFHQRQYRWPVQGVGPVNLAGRPHGVSKPPIEVASGQGVWPMPPLTLVPIFAVDTVAPAAFGGALDTEFKLPQRGMSLRETWTFYKEMPWTPTAFLRNVNLEGDTHRFILSGVTYDQLGTIPVAGCRVLILEAGALAQGTSTVVLAETVSDGSGNYSVQVPGRSVQVHVYLPGSPDRAGVSRNDVIEQVTNIFMRDPTVAGRSPAPVLVIGVN